MPFTDALQKVIDAACEEVIARYQRTKPLKPLPDISTSDWTHGCLFEPCPTCKARADLGLC